MGIIFLGGEVGFHETAIFPETIAVGATAAPRWNTAVIELDGGEEERVGRWEDYLWSFNAAQGIKTQADAASLLRFFNGRRGALYGFRFKNWWHYATNPTGMLHTPTDVPITPTDQLIGTGDGVTTTFQLFTEAADSINPLLRIIYKPRGSTVRVAVNGVEATSGWSLDETTGIVTFTTPPANTHDVTWGGEFDVPARFGVDVDLNGLLAQAQDYNAQRFPSVPIDELRGPNANPDMDNLRGSQIRGQVSADFTLSLAQGALQTVEPLVTGVKAILPEPGPLPDGVGHWVVRNVGLPGNTLLFVNQEDTLLATVDGTQSGFVMMSKDANNVRRWIVAVMN